jgi:hypothetical protein
VVVAAEAGWVMFRGIFMDIVYIAPFFQIPYIPGRFLKHELLKSKTKPWMAEGPVIWVKRGMNARCAEVQPGAHWLKPCRRLRELAARALSVRGE